MSAVASPARSTAPSPSARRRPTEVAAELLTRREFWNRIEGGDARVVFVAVFKSLPSIGEREGEEAADIAEKLFIDICRFATGDAEAEARLSPMVFSAFWPALARDGFATEVFQRWFPLRLGTPRHDVVMDAAWFALEVSPGETSRDVFDRVVAEVGGDAFPRGWDGQVG